MLRGQLVEILIEHDGVIPRIFTVLQALAAVADDLLADDHSPAVISRGKRQDIILPDSQLFADLEGDCRSSFFAQDS